MQLNECRSSLFTNHLFQGLTRPTMIKIFVQRIELPQSLIQIVDPELGLLGITAFHPLFPLRGNPCLLKPTLRFHERGRIGKTKAKMIERTVGNG